MKRLRAEYDWWDDTPSMTTGSVSDTAETDDASDLSDFAGVLLVPDVEQRRGWREFYVKRPPKPGARQIGFRR